MDSPAAVPADVPGRVLWRCRRGMKELDLVLMRYLRMHWSSAGPQERGTFERILDLPDPILAACLMRHEAAPEAELEVLLARLREI